jgi:TP901 family phage tail tape measure protein
MADSSATLSIIVKLVDEASAALKEVGTGVQGFGSKLQASKQILQETAIASGVAFAGLSAAAASSISSFSSFDTLIQKAGANVGATSQQLQQFRDVALQASRETSTSADDVANALFYLAGGSVNANDAMQALQQTITFAKANQLELTQATVMSSQLMSLFKVKADDVTSALDLVTKAGQISFATAGQLSDSFAEAAPIASQLGVSITDLTAIIGAMGDTGHLGTQAGVELKRAFEQLVKPTKETKDGLASLGLSVSDVQSRLSHPIELLQLLQDHLESVQDPVQRAAALSMIFGQIAGPAMSALLSNGTASVKNYKEQLEGAAGATQDAFGRIQSAQDPIKQIGIDLHNLSIQIGQALQPAVTALVHAIEPFLAAIGKWVAEHPKWAAAIIGIAIVLAGLLLVLSTLGLAIIALTPVFAALVPVIMAVGGSIAALSAPVLLVIGLFALLAYVVITRWNDIKTGTQVVWDAIKSVIKSAIDYIVGIVTGLFDTVMGIVNKIISAVSSVSGAVSSVAGAVGGAAFGAGSLVMHTIIPHFAAGGIVTGPTLGLIGEAGPEAIIPLSQLGAGGIGGINITITGNTISSQLDVRGIAQAVSAEIVRTLRMNQKVSG